MQGQEEEEEDDCPAAAAASVRHEEAPGLASMDGAARPNRLVLKY